MRKIMSHLMTVLVIVLAVYLIRTFVLMPISIDGDSMEPTLHNQDFLMMERLSYYFDEPERFDIVVFHATKQKDYIKRIIGLPGETVEYKDNQLFINGREKKEYFLTYLSHTLRNSVQKSPPHQSEKACITTYSYARCCRNLLTRLFLVQFFN